ncbi:MAG: glycosyltransferase [Cellvibrionaceae bacterium]|nr:glycosyltransferase [Cellvibrionaceae bacterium]
MQIIQSSNTIGFVAIGRNEGERLKVALRAIRSLCPNAPVVYVDSGSDDDSVAFANSLQITTVELDMSIPFTAARARNTGFETLLLNHPQLEFVQFMDGDCELQAGWIETAHSALHADNNIGIASGRREEKYPQASIYNTLIDIEWNTPVGETLAVLGDMFVRVSVFKAIKGFDETIIAAEDDDFCIRARRAGHKVYRLDALMSRHDANITRLSQWYRRSKRGGHGYANIFRLHGKGPDKYFHGALKSVLFWGALIPCAFAIFLFVKPTIALLLLLGYIAFVGRTILRKLKAGTPLKIALAYGLLIYTGKIPEFMGVLHYLKNHLLSRKHQLIEYK